MTPTPGGAPPHEADECACDPDSWLCWEFQRGPICLRSPTRARQPMYACRLGKAKYERWFAENYNEDGTRKDGRTHR